MTRKAHVALLDQCAYGATLPDKDGVQKPIRKPTALCLTQRNFSSPGIGNRAKASATYQPKMCQELAKQIHHHTHLHRNSSHTTDTAYKTNTHEEPPFSPPDIHQQNTLQTHQHQHHHQQVYFDNDNNLPPTSWLSVPCNDFIATLDILQYNNFTSC